MHAFTHPTTHVIKVEELGHIFGLQNQNDVFVKKEEWVLQHLALFRVMNICKSFYI